MDPSFGCSVPHFPLLHEEVSPSSSVPRVVTDSTHRPTVPRKATVVTHLVSPIISAPPHHPLPPQQIGDRIRCGQIASEPARKPDGRNSVSFLSKPILPDESKLDRKKVWVLELGGSLCISCDRKADDAKNDNPPARL